jgi:hypothetical protein
MIGSYFETVATNATSISIALGNIRVDQVASKEASTYEEDNHHRGHLHTPAKRKWLAHQVNLMVEIEDVGIFEAQGASSVGKIVENLNPRKEYKIKIMHLGQYRTDGFLEYLNPQVLEFEGFLLGRPAVVQGLGDADATTTSRSEKIPSLIGSHSVGERRRYSAGLRRKPVIELVTSEFPSIYPRPANEDKHVATTATQERVDAWYTLLGSKLSADIALVPIERSSLLTTDVSQLTVHDLFFRSGPKGAAHLASRPWSFGAYQPTVLVLQFGLSDFVHFLSNREETDQRRRSQDSWSQFTRDFVDAYVKFIKSVRSNAYPFQATANSFDPFNPLDDDGSYVYNSAPSTLPIFLLPPFSSHRRLVMRKQTLHKVISDALAQVSSTLQTEGDKSTYWIDTAGWLNAEEDFHPPCDNSSLALDPDRLTADASAKVASLLADHLCSYIKGATDSFVDPPDRGDCPFDRYDNYLGNVYVPEDRDMARALLERKIENLKQRLRLE